MTLKQPIYIDVNVIGYPGKSWHPVEAEYQHSNCYLVLESSDDPEHENWQFEHGDVVHCELNEFYEGETGLIAVSKCDCENA